MLLGVTRERGRSVHVKHTSTYRIISTAHANAKTRIPQGPLHTSGAWHFTMHRAFRCKLHRNPRAATMPRPAFSHIPRTSINMVKRVSKRPMCGTMPPVATGNSPEKAGGPIDSTGVILWSSTRPEIFFARREIKQLVLPSLAFAFVFLYPILCDSSVSAGPGIGAWIIRPQLEHFTRSRATAQTVICLRNCAGFRTTR